MNNKILKAGILIVMLVVPVFIFLFLDFFGKNEFELPYYFPVIDESGHPSLDSNQDTLFQKSPSFELINQDGDTFNSKSLEGKIYVVNFFFSRCGAICPVMNKNLARVYNNVNLEKVKFVSISIDPQNDSSAVLKEYARQFEVNSQAWSFLTGDKRYIYDLAIKGFKLPVSDASQYDNNLSIDETFIHSEKFLLIDTKGFTRGIYDGTNVPDVERLMTEIDVLLSNE